MFREGRRGRDKWRPACTLTHMLCVSCTAVSIVSMTALTAVDVSGADDDVSGVAIATDLREPAEFAADEEIPLSLDLDFAAEDALQNGGTPRPLVADPSGKPLAAEPTLVQPASVGGAPSPKHDEETTSRAWHVPKLLHGDLASATPQQREDAQELIQEVFAAARLASSSDEYSAVLEVCQEAHDSTQWTAGRDYFRRLSAWAYNRRGEERIREGRPQDALADFHRAVQMDPQNWRAAHNRGVSHAESGDLSAAVRDFSQVLRLQPDYGPAYRNRGEVYFEAGQYAQAVHDYTRALAHMPQSDELYYLRADAQHRLGRLLEALEDYDASLRVSEDVSPRLLGRASVHSELGNYAAAIADLDKVIKRDPGQAEAYRAVAWLLATCPDPRYRRPEKALVAARHALKLQGNTDPRYYDTLAAAYAATENFSQAASVQQHAVRLAAGQEDQQALKSRLALYYQNRPLVNGPTTTDSNNAATSRSPGTGRAAGPNHPSTAAGLRQPLRISAPR